jgi:cytoskeletal protein RodZ
MSTPETPPSAGGDDPGRGLSGVQRASVILGALAVLLLVFVLLRGSGDDSASSSSSSQATATQTTGSSGTQSSATGETETETESTGTSDSTSTSGSTSTSTPPAPAVQTIIVKNGQPQGGIKTISYKKGDQVALKVQSDVADEVHVHGYDLKKDVAAGGSVRFAFEATIEGRFEVELENAGTQIANLEVTPS